VGDLLERLPEPEAAALLAALADRQWTEGELYDALADEGHTVGQQTIGRHRRGACRCRGSR
jgi:hypothetical protein